MSSRDHHLAAEQGRRIKPPADPGVSPRIPADPIPPPPPGRSPMVHLGPIGADPKEEEKETRRMLDELPVGCRDRLTDFWEKVFVAYAEQGAPAERCASHADHAVRLWLARYFRKDGHPYRSR